MSEPHAADRTRALALWHRLRAPAPGGSAERSAAALDLALLLAEDTTCRAAVTKAFREAGALRWPDASDWLRHLQLELESGHAIRRVLQKNRKLALFLALHPEDAAQVARWARPVPSSISQPSEAVSQESGASDGPSPPSQEGPAGASASAAGTPSAQARLPAVQAEREQGQPA